MSLLSTARTWIFVSLLVVGTNLLGARKETWLEVRSPHFVAYSDASESRAREALKGFEGIRSVFSQVFPNLRVDPPKPMIVLILEDDASMQRFLPKEFEGKDTKRPGGMYFSAPDRNYAILRLDVDVQASQPYFVLFHEYTHAIVHQNFARAPLWLNEGIADFYAATEIRSRRVYVGRVPLGRLETLRNGSLLPLETLLTVTHDSPHYRQGEKSSLFYAQSWAAVHYLFMDEQARKAGLLGAYLRASEGATDPIAAARAGFGDLGKFQEALTAYIRRHSFRFWDLPLKLELTDKDFQVRNLEEAEALVVRAEYLQYSRQEEAARPLLTRALALAPKQPAVHAAMGYGHVLRGQAEEARLAFEEAVRLGSNDFRPSYYLGVSLQNGAGAGSQHASEIIGWLERSLKLRPDFPGAHMALCQQYARDPRDPERALTAGKTAVELEPNNLTHRANLGIACMNLDLENEAKALGDQLQRSAVNPEERGLAESYATRLAEYLERKKIYSAIPPPADSSGQPGETTPRGQRAPLKFKLPSHLQQLGWDVLRLDDAGRTDEAIKKVEEAIARARYDYDRKALRSLLKTLRERAQQK